MRQKRVLLVTENLGSGGAERQLVGLAVFLQEKGFVVKVATYYKNQFFEPFLRKNKVEYELLNGAFDKRKRLFVIGNLIKKFKPDTVISYLPVPNMIMCILKLIYKFRLIVSERSHTLCWGKETFVRFNLYRLANKVVCNSFSEEENIVSHCSFLKKTITTIPNFVDTERFFQKGLTPQKISILSVGRLTEQKNVLRAIESLGILRKKGYSFDLIWIGSHYDKEYVSKVEKSILDNDMKKCVHIVDQQNDLLPYYQNASFFFFPSFLEGYPNVLCEAMSCGLPVVCSNVCEMPKIVKEGVNGFLFNPLDVNEMVNALEKMISINTTMYEKMRITNRMQVVRNNSKEAFVNQYVKLI